MTIKIEISANNAEGIAAQLHEFVQTFVAMAKATEPTPFDGAAKPGLTTPRAEVVHDKVEPARRTRKKAEVVEATAVADPLDEAPSEEVTPDQVRAKLNELRQKKGNDALGKVVTQFAPKFSEIPLTSYPKLYAVALRELAA